MVNCNERLKRFALKLQEWFYTACQFCIRLRKVFFYIGIFGFAFLISGAFYPREAPFEVSNGTMVNPVMHAGDTGQVVWNIQYLPWCDSCDFRLSRIITGCGIYPLVVSAPVKPERVARFIIPDTVQAGSMCIYTTVVEYSCNAWQRLFPQKVVFPPVLFRIEKRALDANHS